ncbi:hypothetical protein Sme01_60570 [Sphaerisporangium melleum]|uniref:ABM domain-containing protein n=1 Tax=Sphaerisporangium melleum TaxID=321316 RepID=A0A917RBM6_9ACTN|nr:antibiotic biosynthesis monooxygenase [Sphaerisporangium melleum]GGK99362.1 hypothetical protein GCM10007964_46760 [Sphaerisporangium melleum]GII73581.1 hypothetical protein Sme01_60570 [Sphaerisporangium melleum]
MEVVVAVTAFAGAIFAAIVTGILAGRLRDERSGWLIAWTATTAALCLALGAVAIGHLMGFGSVTFRVYQITGAFLAPFWLAVGVIQMLARKAPARFAAWLFGIAFTLVTVVILILDPVSNPDKFTKALPLGDTHWTIIPTALLSAAHALVYLMLIGCLIVAVLRWRSGDDVDADNMHAAVVLAPTGLALVGAVRFAIPGVFAALVTILMVGAVWYAVARPLAPYDEERDGPDDDWDEERPSPRRRDREPAPEAAYDSGPLPAAPAATATSALPPPPRRSNLGDLVAEYRAGDPGEVDHAARMGGPAGPPGGYGGPMTGEFFGQDVPVAGLPGQGTPAYGQHAPAQHAYGAPPADPAGQYGRGPFEQAPGTHAGPDGAHRGPGPQEAMPATGMLFNSNELRESFGIADAGGGLGRRAEPAPAAHAPSVRPSSSIYGLLTVFTLMDGAGEAFDRLAEETVEAVRRSEPDTLIFICHSVKSAPLQRIVYEIYRDEVAFTEHQRQAHMERFARERVAHVLAANVIELNVSAAKVVPLPTAFHV